MTNGSRVNDPPILGQKQQNKTIFDKTDFWGLKYPLDMRVQHETCSTICGTPVLAILNLKAEGGAKNSQIRVFFEGINIATFGCFFSFLGQTSQKNHPVCWVQLQKKKSGVKKLCPSFLGRHGPIL